MSYTIITAMSHSTPQANTIPVSELRVGDKVYAFVDRQEGDDCDFCGFKLLTISAIYHSASYTELEFKGIRSSDEVLIEPGSYIEINGNATI